MIKARFKKMENTYGISKLSINNNSDSILYQSVIYSSNGTFKTSFSRALNNLSKGNIDDIKDRLTNIPASIEIEFIDENGVINKNDFENKFIVFSRELYDRGDIELSKYLNELSLLTVDNVQRNKLNIILKNSIEKIIDSLKLKVKKAGLNIDKTINLLTNKEVQELNINDLYSLLDEIEQTESYDISMIDLKNLFQKAYDPIDNIEFEKAANNYVSIFNKRLNDELFDENFNDSNCMNFLDEIKKNNFLSEEKKRGIIIKEKEYYKYDDVEIIFKDAIKKISSDPTVLAANRELIKSMGISAQAKKLQQQFKDNPLLINQLSIGKRKIVLIALKNQNIDILEFKTILDDAKKQYLEIIKEAQNKRSEFENAIDIYKSRFNPTFDIFISNKVESILGESVPILTFKHHRNTAIDISETELRKILSSGEKTALNIICFIVEYEANKHKFPILVMDDLVETFDYVNRHAFIEYIDDLVKNNVSIIVLTHNFEFYRTLLRRIPELDKLSAYSVNGKVYVEENKKLNKDIEKVFEIWNINQLIFAIPFLREIKTMLKDDTSKLDNCLHYKKETRDIKIVMIRKIFPNITFNSNDEDMYLDILYGLADTVNVSNYYDIVPKTILSIACRLKIEEKIIKDDFKLIEDIDSNQLAQLKDKYKDKLTPKILKLIDCVQISTPEFIHCNSFMYEPLVDIDGKYLKKLYDEIKNLNDEDIWIKKNV